MVAAARVKGWLVADAEPVTITPPVDALGRVPGILPVWARYSRLRAISAACAADVLHLLTASQPMLGSGPTRRSMRRLASRGQRPRRTCRRMRRRAGDDHLCAGAGNADAFMPGTVSKGFSAPGGAPPGAHHTTHEPGGRDAPVNAAWTNREHIHGATADYGSTPTPTAGQG